MEPGYSDVTTLDAHSPESCKPVSEVLQRVGDKWTVLVVKTLGRGPMRFNELQRTLGGVTHRTLSKTLKEMEAAGLVTRYDHRENPPRVDYALTPKGRSLQPVLQAMEDWAAAHARGDA